MADAQVRMTVEDVIDVLNRLDAAGVEWWIDGGWGVDALLRAQTRPHADLDFAIRSADVEILPAIFPEFHRINEDHWPSAYVLRDGQGRELDFHPLELDEQGNGWQPQADGSRVLWPREALAGRGVIGGRQVRCTSPEFQIEAHLYTGHDDLDWAAVVALCENFGLPIPTGGAPGFVQERRSSVWRYSSSSRS
jgi:lincosamide nucleotidyltransferase A/C/D/E